MIFKIPFLQQKNLDWKFRTTLVLGWIRTICKMDKGFGQKSLGLATLPSRTYFSKKLLPTNNRMK
jgi:hypothetical protein